MGGGFPISGVIGKAEIMDLPDVGNMSSTHSGNPVMSEAGLAVLEEIESKNLVNESLRKGNIMHKKLHTLAQKFPNIISSIQGKGLIAAILFNNTVIMNIEDKVSQLVEVCMQKGLLVVHTGRESIKLGPPLTINDEALTEGLDVLEESFYKIFSDNHFESYSK
jgi:4-aminobutyrate aminotransferase-like enzyme